MAERPANKRGIHLVDRQIANPEKQQEPLTRKTFKSGQVVPHSGVYKVVHSEHRLPHEVTLLRADTFPPCSKCGVLVKFKLLRAVTVESFKVVLNTLPEVASLDDLEGFEKAG
jgi:hypothetical protein